MEAGSALHHALDTLALLISGALVMWMTAGFAMREAGLVPLGDRAGTLYRNIGLYAVACIGFMALGQGIMVPASGNGLIPDIDWAALLSLQPQGDLAGSGGIAAFFLRTLFAATALAIVSGAMAGRVRLWSLLLFGLLLSGLIYPIQAYWSWGGGWLAALGFRDLAGAGVVHLCGAAAALAGALLLGPRPGRYDKPGTREAAPAAGLPLVTLGTLILWFGWFGLNGGAVLALNGISDPEALARVFVNTNLAAAGGLILALLMAGLPLGRAEPTLALNGALAGLVAISAAPVAPSPLVATLIGAVGGLILVLGSRAIDRLRVDDPVGAISVHGLAGAWGLMAVPISDPQASFGAQAIGLGAILGWVFLTSLIAWLVIRVLFGLRLRPAEEAGGG